MVNDLKVKMRGFYKKMMNIQKGFRVHQGAMKLRMNHLGKTLWDRERNLITKQCMGKKVSKQKQEIFKKVNIINDNVKEAILKTYLKRCQYKYQVNFLEWRLDFKFSSASEAIVSFQCDIFSNFREIES